MVVVVGVVGVVVVVVVVVVGLVVVVFFCDNKAPQAMIGIWDLGFCDLVWLWLGCGNISFINFFSYLHTTLAQIKFSSLNSES